MIRVYFDIDGVLAEHDAKLGIAPTEPGFFLNLPVLPGAHELVDAAIRIFGCAPNILSRPIDVKGFPEIRNNCVIEKTKWINNHFPGKFDQLNFAERKDAYATSESLLIDDNVGNTIPFHRAGGFCILYTGDVQSAIEEMKQVRDRAVGESLLRSYISDVLKV